MKKKTFEFAFVPPQTMLDAGITPVVIAYLNGQLKKLPEDLSWAEFAYIWSVEKEKFEKTSYFYKKKMTEFNSVDSKIVNDSLVLKLKDIIQKVPLLKELCKKHLPVREVFALCEGFWESYHLFEERKSEIGTVPKTEIIQELIDLSIQEKASRGICSALKYVAGENKQFRQFIELITDMYLKDNPDDYNYDHFLHGMSERRKKNYILALQKELTQFKSNGFHRDLFSKAMRAYMETKDIQFI